MDRQRLSRTLAGGSGRVRTEQRRLVAYSAVALLVLGFYLFNRDRSSAPPEAALPSAALEEPKVAAPLAHVESERLASVADSTPAQRAEIEREPAAHLLEQASQLVYGDLEKLGMVVADRVALEQHGADHRGDAVYALGELQWFEPITDSQGYRVRGEIKDEEERSWNFLVVTEPFEVRVGDVIKVAGFYLKQYDMLRPDRSTSSGPLIIGEELLRSSYRIEPVTALRPDLFLRVRDYDLTEASRPLESPEFYELLSYVNQASLETMFPEGSPPQEFRASELMRNTDAHRGEALRVSGLLAAVQEVPLGPRGENPLGIPFVWNLWLSSYSGATLLITFEKPEGLVPKLDVVDADGIYFRRFAYENQLGQPYTAAVVIARRLQKYVAPKNDFSPLLIKITIGIVATVVLAAWLMSRRDESEAVTARSRRMTRLKKLASLPGVLSTKTGAGRQKAPEDGPTDSVGPAGPSSST